MRMWMLDPKCLCDIHLNGEHGEMHKHLYSFRKGHRVDGRFNPVVQIQFIGYKKRHDELAKEMIKRNMRHLSPMHEADLPDFRSTYPRYCEMEVDTAVSIDDLCQRCPDCRVRIVSNLLQA